jgi:CelD/BcsL family acetyltransferase involved in cellulose biosynthesis
MTSGPRPALTLEVVDDGAGFDALRERWNEAAEAGADPNVFLTWEWLRTWWRHFGEDRDARLHVVVVSDADGIVAAAPLYRWQRRLARRQVTALRQISHDAGDYGGMLLVRHHDAAVATLVDHLAAQLHGGVDVVVLSRLASDSVLLAALRRALTRPTGLPAEQPATPATPEPVAPAGSPADHRVVSPIARRRRTDRPPRAVAHPDRAIAAHEVDLGDACPYADLRDGYDLRRHLKKHKVRQRLRRLTEKHADTTFTHHTGEDLDEGLRRLLAVHRRRWEAHEDEQQGLLADPAHEAFLLDAVRALDARGHLRLMTLTAGGETIAADLDLAFGDRLWLLKGAFDPRFAEFSPGQLVTYRTFEDAIASGVQEIDFMRGDHPYKRRWTNADRRLVTLTLTRPGLRGRLATTLYRASRPSRP